MTPTTVSFWVGCGFFVWIAGKTEVFRKKLYTLVLYFFTTVKYNAGIIRNRRMYCRYEL